RLRLDCCAVPASAQTRQRIGRHYLDLHVLQHDRLRRVAAHDLQQCCKVTVGFGRPPGLPLVPGTNRPRSSRGMVTSCILGRHDTAGRAATCTCGWIAWRRPGLLEAALLRSRSDVSPTMSLSEAAVRPGAGEDLAVAKRVCPRAIRLAVAPFALVTVAVHPRGHTSAMRFAIAELALVAVAVCRCEDAATGPLAVAPIAVVAVAVGPRHHAP